MEVRLFFLLRCTLLVASVSSPLSGEDFNPPPITTDAEQELANFRRENAALSDVEFVDAEYGWAVGNHGAIWHTSDGGKHWHLQTSSTSADLHGVSFVDRDHGWAVGGETRPYIWTSQAVVLRTTDGGKTWQQLLALVPALEKVQFFDTKRGVAWGRGSGGYPLGVFATEDAGRNWRPLAGGVERCWSGGDFVDRSHGILVDQQHVARIEFGDWLPVKPGSNLPLNGMLHAAHLNGNGTAWLVGDNGQMLRSRSLGATWETVNVLPAEIASRISWRSIAQLQDDVWVLGNPGSIVLNSTQGGNEWQGFATGNRVPLADADFVDSKNGWAVGALGTILHTSDGGRTWSVQRKASTSVDLLIVVDNPGQLPLATIAKTALVDRRQLAVHLQTSLADRSELESRICEALSLLGCDIVEFDMPGIGDAEVNHKAPEEHLAQLLRTWQPKVLVVPEVDSSANKMVDRAQTAALLATDETALPFLQNQLALPPWQTKRIFALLPPGSRGTHRVDLEEVWLAGGGSLVDRVAQARGLLEPHYASPPAADELRLAVSLSGDPGVATDDLLAGLAERDEYRQAADSLALDPREKQRRRRLAEKRRNLQNIFRASGGNPALLAQVGPLIADLDSVSGAHLLLDLANEFATAGQVALQAETLELVARRYPDDPLTDHALVWLVQYYASEEASYTARRGFAPEAQLAGGVPSENASSTKVPAADGIQTAAAEIPASTPQLDRLTRAIQITQHIAHTRPLLYSEPQLRVPWARAELRRGESQSPQKYLESLALRYPGDPWQAYGEAERWLADPSSSAPKLPLLVCRFASERPHLDGHFDEAQWQTQWTNLQLATTSLPHVPEAQCKFACDREFLYFALRCKRLPDAEYSEADAKRTYDADLTEKDRIVIQLDIDRDYATFYELAVDYRGWTQDNCWGNTTWNPHWFVATAATPQEWSIEAAIPWSELVSTPPTSDDAWAVSVSRHSGGGELQSLNSPESGAGKFGLLDFR